MYKDPTEFRARFKAYKEGKMPYENGLPKFAGGTPGLTSTQQAALDDMYNYFNPLGYDIISISGMGGNGLLESGLNPDIVSKSGYAGVWQNNKNLQNAIKDMYGDHSKDNLFKYANAWVSGDQLIRKGKHAAHTALGSGKFKKAGYKTAEEAADAWLKNYERAVILDSNRKVIGYQDQGKRKAFAKAAYNYLYGKYGKGGSSVAPEPIVEQAVSTAVRPTIPAEQTHTTWEGSKNVSPFITGKPMLRPIHRIQLPNLIEAIEDDQWEPGFPGLKNGKLPRYDDGTPIKVGEYNVYPSAVGASELKVTVPEVVVTGKDRRPVYQRYDAENSTYDPDAIRTFTDWTPVVSDIGQGLDAYNAFKNKDYLLAGILSGMLLLPTALEKPGKALVKTGLKYAPEFTKALYDLLYQYRKATDNPRLRGYLNEVKDLLTSDKIRKRAGENYNFMWGNNIDTTPIYFLHSKYNFDRPSFKLFGKQFTSPIPLPRQYAGIYQPNLQQIGIRRNGLDPNRIRTTSYHEGSHASDLGRDTNIYNNLSANYREDYFGLDTEKRARVLSVLTDAQHNGVDIDSWDEMKQFLNSDYNNKNYKDLLLFYDTLDGKPLLNTILKGYKDGKSPIHIKPANRGKLTRLKARTGKSESELYNDGNPAHKKMVVFARNARKWSHK